MAKIYVTYRKRNDEVVDHEYQTDLIFFEVDYQNQADTTVRCVEHDYDADLKVYKAGYQYRAK